jgi:hypothetical protein
MRAHRFAPGARPLLERTLQMTDRFEHHTPGLESPAAFLLAVTPDDATDLPVASRALNVAQSGLVQVTTSGGSVASVYIAAGTAFPVRAIRVWATGTTATGITALS